MRSMTGRLQRLQRPQLGALGKYVLLTLNRTTHIWALGSVWRYLKHKLPLLPLHCNTLQSLWLLAAPAAIYLMYQAHILLERRQSAHLRCAQPASEMRAPNRSSARSLTSEVRCASPASVTWRLSRLRCVRPDSAAMACKPASLTPATRGLQVCTCTCRACPGTAL